MNRSFRPLVGIIALAAFFFAQLMGAAHACELGLNVKMAAQAVTASAMDECCGEGQPQHDAACDNHCQLGDKAPDRAQSAALPAMAVIGDGMRLPAPPPTASRPAIDPAPDLSRHIEPSISIRNCCFRI